jgi:(E)-4-hydroxy-3-methylbut-2-enyl-diphosphate synthase
MVGDVGVGGDNPLRLQSMTTTPTQDTNATVEQVIRLVNAGCEIVRITAPTEIDAKNLKNIATALRAKNIHVPLVADIHFRPEAALEAANHVEKVRINPGNFTDSKMFKKKEYTDKEYTEELERIEERFTPLVLKLKRLGRSLRLGTNHGSLSDRIMNRYGDSPEGMVESALEFVRICEKNSFRDIILSMKSSNPKVMIAGYRLLAARMEEEGMDYPFHLGVTEAGDGEDGRIKSAAGIGSLLEDGIGDTIRVSLTEDPERELPVAQALAASYNERPSNKSSAPFPLENPYTYTRRPTRELALGPIRWGGEQTIPVVNNISRLGLDPETLLSTLETQLKSSKNIPPEILEWDIHAEADVHNLQRFRRQLHFETSRIGYLARIENPDLVNSALSVADGILVKVGTLSLGDIAQKTKAAHKPLGLEAENADDLLKAARVAATQTPDLFVSLSGKNISHLIHHWRRVVADQWVKGRQCPPGQFPFLLRFPPGPMAPGPMAPGADTREDYLLKTSILLGSLLCDGFGDAIHVGLEKDLADDLSLAYNVLQGAGARVTKTEYVSCPSCGRTLFDLQSTTERIKRQTGHLVGVKIAIMGCIVNGPGEMADADFGYVGGGPGKVNLYVGKNCVEKGILTQNADQKLIALIKSHGKWQEDIRPPEVPMVASLEKTQPSG